jgi:hypothetical protein
MSLQFHVPSDKPFSLTLMGAQGLQSQVHIDG